MDIFGTNLYTYTKEKVGHSTTLFPASKQGCLNI